MNTQLQKRVKKVSCRYVFFCLCCVVSLFVHCVFSVVVVVVLVLVLVLVVVVVVVVVAVVFPVVVVESAVKRAGICQDYHA